VAGSRSWPVPVPLPTDGTGRRVLSVGTAGGITSGFVGLPDGAGLVRLGGSLLSLDEAEYQLWDAGLLAPATEPLLEQARQSGMAEPDRVLRELAEAGLVIDSAVDPASARHLAGGHAVRFTGRLVGNGPHQSPRFLVGAGTAAPPLTVDVVVYQFLLWADGRASITDQCARLDTGGVPWCSDAAAHVAGWIPALLSADLISLDLVVSAEGPGAE
jgi:hypothetical protein